MQSFTYDPAPQRVVFGHGKCGDIAAEVDRLAAGERSVAGSKRAADGTTGAIPLRRVLVLTTKGGAALGERVQSLLGERCVAVCNGAEMHTPVAATERAMSILQGCQADTLVAIGGGSAIGLAKALALRTGLPQIVIPTTYSGSEATSTLGQTEDGKKIRSSHPSILAKTIIYDPALTETLGEHRRLTSGMNAMAHAVEALYAHNSNPVSEQLAVAGIEKMETALRRQDLSEALMAAWLCGSCLATVDMGLHHKLAHTFGGQLGTPHSETHAILLPYTLLYNFNDCEDRAQWLFMENFIEGFDPFKELDDEPDILLACYFRDILTISTSPSIPTSLKELGVKEADLDGIVETVMTSAPYPNPAPLDAKRLRKMLQLAWHGTRPEESL